MCYMLGRSRIVIFSVREKVVHWYETHRVDICMPAKIAGIIMYSRGSLYVYL